MPSTTRGPLPPGIYWRRRLTLLSLGLVLVLAIGKVLSLSSDGSSDPDGATRAAAEPSATASSKQPGDKTSGKPGKGKPGKGKTPSATPSPTPPPLPEPQGPCQDSDVLITPSLVDAVAGHPVTIVLNVQTGVTEACTWHLSSDTMTLKITSGPDDIWSSRECARVIPSQAVVVRRAVATQVPLVWNSRRSDEYCSERTAWALPGFYHVAAAALSGEPTDVQFELTLKAQETVTVTAEPEENKGKGKGKNKPNG